MRVLGAVIAGGHSSRMGGTEKAFLLLDGVPLAQRVMSRIGFQVDDMIINANGDATRFNEMAKTVVPDHLQSLHTPLAGLHAVLRRGEALGFDAVLTVPSDTPFLPLDLVSRLASAGQYCGAAVATSGGQTHHLTGLWSTAMFAPLDTAIAEHRLFRMKDAANIFEIATADWATEPHDPFFNINDPIDLKTAEALLGH